MSQSSEEERQREFERLLAQARTGSRDAFQELVDPFESVLRYRARRRLAFRLKAKMNDSDVRQITYLKSFENLSQFRGNSYDEFGCWLLGIMDHVCNAVNRSFHCQARDISREVPLEVVKKKLTTNRLQSGDEGRFRMLELAWRELPARYQLVIRLHYHEKCSHQEIGNRLGLSPDAAKHLHRRAIRKLAEGAERHREE